MTEINGHTKTFQTQLGDGIQVNTNDWAIEERHGHPVIKIPVSLYRDGLAHPVDLVLPAHFETRTA